MAESLGRAWRDLNVLLEKRRVILEKNYLFQGHWQDFQDKTEDLERLCISNSSDSRSLRQAKRTMLEAAVYTLQEGDSLLLIS